MIQDAYTHHAEVVHYKSGTRDSSDVDTYDERRYLGAVNEYRQAVMAATYQRMTEPLAGGRVLDVGCGTGRGAVVFAKRAAFTVGVDASSDMLACAKRKLGPQDRCHFLRSYAQALPFKSGVFDAVVSLNFLHLFGLETQRVMITEMKRVVRPGGIVLLEFDNALHGALIGLYKRCFTDERGSLPGEIRYAIGGGCRVLSVRGAVFPVVWRLFYRIPALSTWIERLAWLPLLNRLAHRVYYKLGRDGGHA